MVNYTEARSIGTPTALGLDPVLDLGGLNVAALLSRQRYDAIVPAAWQSPELLPGADSVFVIGSGGSSFYWAARRARPVSPHSLDEFCEELVMNAARTLERAGRASRAVFYWQRRSENDREPGQFVDFVALAEAAGLGARSQLGLLLHPIFGPWFAIRALLLCGQPGGNDCDGSSTSYTTSHTTSYTNNHADSGIDSHNLGDSFDPCGSCSAPCITACPGAAVSREKFAVARCSRARSEISGCAQRCDARLACPVGADYRYAPEALSHHMTSPFREVRGTGELPAGRRPGPV